MERLTSGDFTQVDEPFALFQDWLDEATASEPNDPNGMALSTVDADGLPNSRMVLLKGHGPDGFVFYTNTESQKGEELLGQPKAALLFHWKSLRRQVRIRGTVTPVTDAESDAYFQSRPRDSRIGAWASQQSRPLESRFALEKAVASYTLKFGLGDIPRPPYWRGFRVAPVYIEFWRDGAFRLHDRVIFRREAASADWTKTRFYPLRKTPPMAMPVFDFPKTEVGKRPVMLLTGASRGIGHATVMQFAMAGWRILSCSRQAFSDKCPWPSGADDHVQIDLGDPEDTMRGIAEIKKRLQAEGGKLNALVNNAGISPKGRDGGRLGAATTSFNDWHKVFQVNFFAPIMLARGLLDELTAAKGAIVNVSSIAGSRVHPFAGAAYATSKAALASLTREMAADFGQFGIRVNSISPGEIDTAILSPGTEKIVATLPLKRLGKTDEVAKAIYFLCTDASSYVTGSELHINGGQHV